MAACLTVRERRGNIFKLQRFILLKQKVKPFSWRILLKINNSLETFIIRRGNHQTGGNYSLQANHDKIELEAEEG